MESRSNRAGLTPDVILRTTGALDDEGSPTLAGLLVLGDTPERIAPAARITYRRLPNEDDPPGTRHDGRHFEGTIGVILDKVLAQLAADLDSVQVERDGQVFDESDVPRTALRELLSNALVHRSFSEHLTSSVTVEVSDHAVVITSPGGLHSGTDPSTLGMLTAAAGVRNLTLVRIAEIATTPSGARIIEQQSMGIRSADRACHQAGVLPVLFADHPATFQAMLVRGPLDTESAAKVLEGTDLAGDKDAARLLAASRRLVEVFEMPAAGPFRRVAFDARFAARVLSPTSPEDATVLLKGLENAGALERVRSRTVTAWRPARTAIEAPPERTTPARHQSNDDRMREVLELIDAAPSHELRPKEIAAALGLTSPTSRNRRIRQAVDSGFIKPTKASVFDPAQSYVLTEQGRAFLGRR